MKLRIQSYTRDFFGTVFREIDFENYINEGIDRMKIDIVELDTMPYLNDDADVPTMLPQSYHYMLALYASSRCYAQDEQHFPAGNYRNEFEDLLRELQAKIANGDIVIKNADGDVIVADTNVEYVTDIYFAGYVSEEVTT